MQIMNVHKYFYEVKIQKNTQHNSLEIVNALEP